jgi:hypothetical protein
MSAMIGIPSGGGGPRRLGSETELAERVAG